MTVIGPSTGRYYPNHPMFSFSDHSGVAVDAEKARFHRPLDYGTLNEVAPSARARFRTDDPAPVVKLRFNNLHTGTYYYDVISIYVDGVWHSDYDPIDSRTAFDYDIVLSFGTADFRTIEVVFPYCAGVDFLGAQINPRHRVSPCQPRPSGNMLAIGDSITQNFYVTKARMGFPFLLAKSLGLQCINMGFAGAYSYSHGSAAYIATMDNVEVVTVLLGINDAAAAVSLAAYQANMQTLLSGVLSNLGPTAKVLVISPIWVSFPPEFNVDGYRARVADVVTAIGDARLRFVNGLSLCGNNTTSVPDGVHPGDIGNAEMAAALYTAALA